MGLGEEIERCIDGRIPFRAVDEGGDIDLKCTPRQGGWDILLKMDDSTARIWCSKLSDEWWKHDVVIYVIGPSGRGYPIAELSTHTTELTEIQEGEP